MTRALNFFILSILTMIGYAQTGDSLLTVEDMMGITLENNFQIKISKNISQIADNNNAIGNAGFLPSVIANANFDKSSQNTEQEFVNGDTQSRTGAKRQVYGAGVDLSWTLFDGTRMFIAKDRLENQSVQAYYDYKFDVDVTLADALSFYYLLALEQDRQDLLQRAIEFSEERLRIVREKYELGKESKLSLLQAQVDLNTDVSASIRQNQQLVDTKLALINIMSIKRDTDFSVDSVFQIDSTLVLGELLQSAQNRNPQILAQELDYQITKQQRKELQAELLPQIDFNMGYNYSNLESEAGFLFRNETAGLNYGFGASFTIFEGFNRRRAIQNAEILAESSQYQLESLLLNIETQIKTNYNNYINNLQLVRIESQNFDIAFENAAIALERFKLGVTDAVQLRQAQVNAVNAQIRYLQAQFEAKQSEITLNRLAGNLSNIQ